MKVGSDPCSVGVTQHSDLLTRTVMRHDDKTLRSLHPRPISDSYDAVVTPDVTVETNVLLVRLTQVVVH